MSAERPRVVIDTGVFVSRLLRPDSISAHAVRHSLTAGAVLVSDATVSQLLAVLARPKFASFIHPDDVQQAIDAYVGAAEVVDVSIVITTCRDASDDKFLELALSGHADVILTGDEDLLSLKPLHILTPRQFLATYAPDDQLVSSLR
jgi:putative PIN family toxin of toxin-antitoxin system